MLGLTATDLYDLTLTAIAFLGFGTFVMNLVMDTMKVNIIHQWTSIWVGGKVRVRGPLLAFPYLRHVNSLKKKRSISLKNPIKNNTLPRPTFLMINALAHLEFDKPD